MTRQKRFIVDSIDLLALAWPVIINRLGLMMLAVVDTIMVGQYSATHLAYMGVGLVPSNILILVHIGLLVGVQVLVAQAFGARDYRACGAVLLRAIPYAFLLGVVGLVLCLFGEPFFVATGQPSDLAENGAELVMLAGLSLPFMGVYMACSLFLEGLRRVRPGMFIMIGANVVNIVLNYSLVFGHFGSPELGAKGALWASLFVRIFQLVAIIAVIWFTVDRRAFGLDRWPRLDWRKAAQMRQLGYFSAVSMGVENGAFNALALFAGIMGAITLASHVIIINVFALGFMLGLGFSAATGIRVGNAHGAGHHRSAYRLGWLGFWVHLILVGALSIAISLNAPFIVGLYTANPEVQQLAAGLLAYLGLAIVIDTSQALFAQCLRARGDTRTPMFIHMVAYGAMMLPLTYVFCFVLERGPWGLVDSTVLSSFISALLGAYFFRRQGHKILSRTARVPAAGVDGRR